MFEWLRVAWIRLGDISNPFVGISYHIHTTIGTGPFGITAHWSTLVDSISTSGWIVIFWIIAVFRLPCITPRPDIGM
jgi:hypothetical protein